MISDRKSKWVKAYFDGRAASYRRDSDMGLWRLLREREAAAVFDLLGPIAGADVVDLGCGSGYYTERLLLRGVGSVAAVDISEAMIRNLPRDPRVHGVVADAATAFTGRRFDAVICAGLLEFASDPEVQLANARSLVGERGRMACLVPSNNFAGRLYRRFHRGHGYEIALFADAQFREMAVRAGWRVNACLAPAPFTRVYGLDAAGLR